MDLKEILKPWEKDAEIDEIKLCFNPWSGLDEIRVRLLKQHMNLRPIQCILRYMEIDLNGKAVEVAEYYYNEHFNREYLLQRRYEFKTEDEFHEFKNILKPYVRRAVREL